MVRKPGHQWETRRGLAVREPAPPGGVFADDPRAEAFDLNGARVVFGLRHQLADEDAASDPDLPFAARAWLLARGQRRIDLVSAGGEVLARGPICPADLSDEVADPDTLVTLAPSVAESVAALDRFDRVVACEASSDYPAQVEQLERLGPDLDPDLDRIAELSPKLTLSSLSVPGMERVVTGLRARGLAQRVCAAQSVDEVLAELEALGRCLGADARALEVVAGMRSQRDALADVARNGPTTRVYLEWWPRPMFTPGADCYSNELIGLAGGVNVFAERPGSSVEISAAELVAADPEVCFVSWCGVPMGKLDPDNLRKRQGLQALAPARAGHVYPLDESFAGRPGPRMLEAARIMAQHIQQFRGSQ